MKHETAKIKRQIVQNMKKIDRVNGKINHFQEMIERNEHIAENWKGIVVNNEMKIKRNETDIKALRDYMSQLMALF